MFHHITPNKIKTISDPSKVLASKFNLLATNADAGGLMYAAMVEHKKYPIYGKYSSGTVRPLPIPDRPYPEPDNVFVSYNISETTHVQA